MIAQFFKRSHPSKQQFLKNVRAFSCLSWLKNLLDALYNYWLAIGKNHIILLALSRNYAT